MAAMSEPAAPIRTERLGIAAVVAATCIWATGTVIVKGSTLDGLQFAVFRLWAGAAISCLALLIARRRLTWATLRACWPGGLLFAVDITLHFSAVKRTNVANVAVIGAMAPVLIALLSSRLLGERIERRDMLLALTAFAGVVVVAVGSYGEPSWSGVGDLLAFLNIFTWTGYWFFSRRARRTTGPIEYFACVMIAGALVLTPTAFLLDGVPAWPTSAQWASVWAVALFPGFVGHTLMIWSHNHVESWRSALITQATPVISTILAWVFLDEAVTPIVAVGGAIVIGCTSAVIVHAARRADDLDETVESPG
jgi:drug/metabolite transporter (DMT)-like permease